jgi:hypothetical protein
MRSSRAPLSSFPSHRRRVRCRNRRRRNLVSLSDGTSARLRAIDRNCFFHANRAGDAGRNVIANRNAAAAPIHARSS